MFMAGLVEHALGLRDHLQPHAVAGDYGYCEGLAWNPHSTGSRGSYKMIKAIFPATIDVYNDLQSG